MNLLRRFLGRYIPPNSTITPAQLPPRTVQSLTARRQRMTVAPRCPPGTSPQYLNGKFTGCSRLPGMGAPVGLGAAADWTNAALVAAASALSANLAANGCQPSFVQEVSDFQSAYIAAGGTIPQDSGGRSPIDGLYGTNTSNALRESDPNAPAGCIGGATGASPTGGGGGGTALSTTGSSTTLFSSMFDGSSSFFGLPSGYWVLGLAGLAIAAVIVNPKPGRAAPSRKRGKKRAKKRSKRSKSRRSKKSSRRGKKKSKRRRNPVRWRGGSAAAFYSVRSGRKQVAVFKAKTRADAFACKYAKQHPRKNIRVRRVQIATPALRRKYLAGAD